MVHSFFEDDHTFTSKEEKDTRTKTRELLFVEIYKDPNWAGKMTSNSHLGPSMGENADGTSAQPTPARPESRGLPDLAPGQKVKLEHKAFVPVKEHDVTLAKPYGDVLDAPLS